MPAKTDVLSPALDRLERALAERGAGRERDWVERVDQALAAVEQGVRQHAATLEAPDGRVVDVDSPRLPSPTVSRRAAKLHQELDGFLVETRALRAKVRGASQGLGIAVSPSGLAGALAVAPEAGAIPDFSVFCKRAKELLEALNHYEEEEADLILEAVTTDIGAGD
ncbi:MAG TPA: hypothetical protein VG013_01345 [Gemmataceae bacterium]|jgi:hypothetical protein|nr:hypothetical protein [Gemmataceae bacterium]